MKYQYKISFHLAPGVVVTFDTNELVDYATILEDEKGTITISGPTQKTQIVPKRHILAVEIIDNEKLKGNQNERT